MSVPKTKPCPFCKEPKRVDADTCPHCGQTELHKSTKLLFLFLALPVLACIAIVVLAALS